ncbi:F-box protein CPR1-like [Salvia hispanica]|uniref:F-box protein CPR1-like n=1 Tax=Salvia hispanica TaxID=49212 RepID=UPI0020090D45|nr:F-box protein CPR1-like [Salvia hispanica]
MESHDLHYIPLTDFDTPQGSSGMSGIAANGLLLLSSNVGDPEIPVYICNPITREYIVLCRPMEYKFVSCFEFCVRKISGQYKVVVSICRTLESDSFQVYTLSTGIWRDVETGVASGFRFYFDGHAECNGNLHWMVIDLVEPYFQICGFDVETERFTIFSAPPSLPMELSVQLTILRDCLCICYVQDYEIATWLMKKYRVDESWTIEYKLKTMDFAFNVARVNMVVRPIKIFKDGDAFMLVNEHQLIYYFNMTEPTQKVGVFTDADIRYSLRPA